MAGASTNEDRFLASCKIVGEADVRQKLGAGRFSERRAEWATKWLEQLESAKSDATKAEESNSRLLKATKSKDYSRAVGLGVLLVVLGGVATVLALW